MNIKTSPAVAQLGKFRSKLAASEAEGFKGQMTQLGINMVDLMMWLVIAALLLAAALQGIGYYQQAAWTYQAKSDVSSVRTFMETQFTLNNNSYPNTAGITAAITANDLKLTGTGADKNTARVLSTGTQGWTASVNSPTLQAAGKDHYFVFGSKDVPDTTTGALAGSDEGSNNPKGQKVATVPAGV